MNLKQANNNNVILFRADGGLQIGLGHIYRLIALSQMIDLPHDQLFVFKGEKHIIEPIIQERFNNYHCIPDNIKLEEEIAYLANMFPKVALVCLDGYHFDSSYQKAWKQVGTFLLSIDDLHKDKFYSDIIINPGNASKPSDYLISKTSKLLLGLDYTILREEFITSAQSNFEKDNNGKKSCFICFGGSDYYGLTQKFLEFANRSQKFSAIYVVIGSANANRSKLLSDSIIHFYQHLSANEMQQLMMSSTIAIVPASGICNEAVSVRMGIITGYYTENQLDILKGLTDLGAVIDLGRFQDCSYELFTEKLSYLLDSQNLHNQHQVQKRLIDGKSPERINTVLKELLNLQK